ncbi:unnamed protein product [Vitrella brassicaformis CCMP3155]|uniref:Protein kinase domain-containing protein n=1 Tax=Vitrella brassicaformis (strain CCMP3155) TaxID=1169540 RepID=A0A0G4EGW8_VITBC|nr:unnamed protein product [Vitrella brassicaformis CCMP3155]|eukprot:CEL94718.1 unnamed protein product [Vitrella brassicaformis CCMP3155]
MEPKTRLFSSAQVVFGDIQEVLERLRTTVHIQVRKTTLMLMAAQRADTFLPDPLLDLMSLLLAPYPDDRPSSRQALKHPFMLVDAKISNMLKSLMAFLPPSAQPSQTASLAASAPADRPCPPNDPPSPASIPRLQQEQPSGQPPEATLDDLEAVLRGEASTGPSRPRRKGPAYGCRSSCETHCAGSISSRGAISRKTSRSGSRRKK